MPVLDLTTAIGSPFDVRRFTLHESISSPFTLEILAHAEDPSIDLESVVGQAATFRLAPGYVNAFGSARVWSGVCSYVEQVRGVFPGPAGSRAYSTYLLRIVPTIWLLTQRKNHRIFQHLSIPDIVDEVFADWKITPKWGHRARQVPEARVQGAIRRERLCVREPAAGGGGDRVRARGRAAGVGARAERQAEFEPHSQGAGDSVRGQPDRGGRKGVRRRREAGARRPAGRAPDRRLRFQESHLQAGRRGAEGAAAGTTRTRRSRARCSSPA